MREFFEPPTECVHGVSLKDSCALCAEDPRAGLFGGGGRCVKSADGEATDHEISRAVEALVEEEK